MLRSTRSLRSRAWDEGLRTSDGVLDVAHMHAAVPQLGALVHEVPVEGAMHDVFLSGPRVRAQAINEYADWLAALPQTASGGVEVVSRGKLL